MTEAIIVVPCFNEASRIRAAGFRDLLGDGALRLLFVDDGSTDATGPALQKLCATLGERASVLSLPANAGKAEAVRRGLCAAIERCPAIVGYLDADLATPPAELLRLVQALRESSAQAALGCRLKLLGARIQRKRIRWILGRAFALAASAALGVRFRDTQCGAKAFRCSAALADALAEPFHARWAFDVELLGRLLTGSAGAAPISQAELLEVPLREWNEVPGSTLRPAHFPLLGLELFRIHQALADRRRALRSVPRALPLPAKERGDAA